MKNDVVPVHIRGILPAASGCALFLGNDEKVFVINVEPQMGQVIGMFLRDTPKERPLTHDLMQSVFKGFGISVDRVGLKGKTGEQMGAIGRGLLLEVHCVALLAK